MMSRRITSRSARKSALPAPGATCSAIAPTAASILTLIAGIERHSVGAPAAIAFRAALRRKGLQADAAGGLAALDALLHEIADDDPGRIETRMMTLRVAWGELMGRQP